MKRLLLILALPILLALPASAQVAAQATATGFYFQGNWYAATTETESMPLIFWGASKGNSFAIGARELIVPSLFNVYGGVGTYQPDLSTLIKKTTLNPDQFQVSFDVMGGMALIASGNKPAIEGRVNVMYSLTPNTALTGAYAGGGMIGSDRFGEVSAGIEYIFNPSASPSAAVQTLVRKAAALKAAKALIR